MKQFGMREVKAVVNDMFSEQMVAARSKKAKAVKLTVGSDGQLEVIAVNPTS